MRVKAARWTRRPVGALWFGLVAVVLDVAGWAVAGQLRDGYDPMEQAIVRRDSHTRG